MNPAEIHSKKILISPLNWGMGHVSRCIPLIHKLLQNQNSVFIACDDSQKNIFNQYFYEKVKFIDHAGYPFQFSGKGNYVMDLFFSMKKLMRRSKSELIEVDRFVKNFKIDIVISDHRYAFRSSTCQSIFMTHQLNLPIGWCQFPFKLYHKKQIKQFDFIWIIDNNTKSIAGKLARIGDYKNAQNIGILSRFMLYKQQENKTENVLIISGPKAYWSQLLLLFSKELNSGEIQTILGPSESLKLIEKLKLNQTFISSENWIQCDKVLLRTKTIVGYIGYTTLMDVQVLNCESNLKPSAGQSEQEYLKIWQKKIPNEFGI